MAEEFLINSQEALASIKLEFEGINPYIVEDFTPMEVILGESLLTPGLQTSVRVHSYFQGVPVKNLDEFKAKGMGIIIDRPILEKFNFPPELIVSQTTYRLDNRKMINNSVEEFVLHACDQTLLDDAATLVSKMWNCETPSNVVNEVLRSCAGAKSLDIEQSGPRRDYVAENIHPFQVVNQQANVALANGDDPSFIHYMTYENLGTHHFRSLYSLTKQSSVATFHFSETGAQQGYGNPNAIMTHMFPCDFDLLSDVLNGVNAKGQDISSLVVTNPLVKRISIFGNKTIGCGIGGGVPKISFSNKGSEKEQNACPDYAYLYIQKRQARMTLLEQDKIALRITVPWNPILHAGKIITLDLKNRTNPELKDYGSGDYLIVNLSHRILYGGRSTTVMDCVSRTVGDGIV